jgi:hypothetical protein
MNETLTGHLEDVVARYEAAAPADWVRIVLWAIRLVDTDGSLAGFSTVAIAVTYDEEGGLGQAYVVPPALEQLRGSALDPLTAGGPEEGWTDLRVEADRDGSHRFDFGADGPHPVEGSATDEFWDALDEYLDRNRDQLDELVGRLRDQGALPGPATPEGGASGLGRLFGRS